MIGPSLSVLHTVPSRRRKLAPALSSPPKQHEPSKRPGTNHLKPTGVSHSSRPSFCTTRSIMLLLTSVFPTAASVSPLRAMGEQIADGHREIVVRIHQARRGRDDSVPVRVRIVGERHLILIFQPHQSGHRVRTGTVHADLPVVIDGHEGKCRVNHRIDDSDIQPIDGVDRLPIRPGGASQGINAQVSTRRRESPPCRQRSSGREHKARRNLPGGWKPH